MLVFQLRMARARRIVRIIPALVSEKLPPPKFVIEVNRRKAAIDYASWTANARHFYIGEIHERNNHRTEMIKILKQTRATVLAVECLPSQMQAYLNGYLAGRNNGSRIRFYLKRRMEKYANSYMRLINYAKGKRIPVIALEHPMADRVWPGLALPRVVKMWEGMGRGLTLSRFMKIRDRHWLRIIKAYQARHPNAKIAVFSGASHLYNLQRLHPSRCPPIDISSITSNPTRVKRVFPPPKAPAADVWKLYVNWQRLKYYQQLTGANNFAVNVNGRIYVIKGKMILLP